jgi:BACON domain-containing protein
MARRLRDLRRALVHAAAAALLACGGGGKDGGDPASAPGMSIDRGALAFSADEGGAVPPAQLIHISIDDPSAAFVGATTPQGETLPTWLAPSLDGSGNSWTLFANILTTNLAPGSYSATLRIGIARADRSVIAYRDARVTYAVAANVTAFPTVLDFTVHAGDPAPAAMDVILGGTSGVGWTVSADQPWVTLGAASGTIPATVPIGVDPSGLAEGTYIGIVTFSGAGKMPTVGIALTVLAAP